jgi:hypothetical protein
MHNPLHLTENYNGQLTDNSGVHSRYESNMVSRNLSSLPFAVTNVEFEASVIDDVFDGIEVHYDFVDDIMAADTAARASAGSYNTAYYNSMWNQTGAFTQGLFQEASEAVADGWYTAWVNAGSPIPNLGLSGDYNGNNSIDAADYTAWRDKMGTSTALMNDPTPASVSAADYDYWKSHFGQSVGGAGLSSNAVPEPSSAALLALALSSIIGCARRSLTWTAACLVSKR